MAAERPDLEEDRNQLIVSNAQMRQELKEIEDQILYRLSTSEGNPVDDLELIKVLEASKLKAGEIQVRSERCSPSCPCASSASTPLTMISLLSSRPRSWWQSRPRRTSTSPACSMCLWLSARRSSTSVSQTCPMWTPCTSIHSSGSSISSSWGSVTLRKQVPAQNSPPPILSLTPHLHMVCM